MRSISYTNVRAHLAHTMQQVCEDHAPIMVTRARAESVVVISLSDFEAIQETCYLTKSPKNAARLAESIDEIEAMINRDKN
jgi:antitoxin YefM